MFAIVKIGNQQFKVKAGDFIRAPYQKLSAGDTMNIPVIAFGTEKAMICDSSQLKKSKVKALLLRQSLANKLIVFKKKRRKGYRRTQGHRQKVTELQILELYSPDGKIFKIETKKKKAGKASSKKLPQLKTAKKPSVKAKKAVESETKSSKKLKTKPESAKTQAKGD